MHARASHGTVERVPIELEHIRVVDAMHRGIVSCSSDAPLREVAGVMADNRVHAVALIDGNGSRRFRVLSDLDVIAAIAGEKALIAGETTGREPVTISSNERLSRAVQLMVEHSTSHLVVVDAGSGRLVGIISTLDVAAVYADGRA